MAGDWIKMRASLPQAPEFQKLARAASLSETELLGALYQLACWFSQYSDYGQMDDAEARVIDFYLRRPGFANALKSVGWLRCDGGKTWLVGFCEPISSRKSLGASVRTEVLASGVCAACGSDAKPEVDHAIPISRGGTSDRSNLQRLCTLCNRKKGRRTMAEFLATRELA